MVEVRVGGISISTYSIDIHYHGKVAGTTGSSMRSGSLYAFEGKDTGIVVQVACLDGRGSVGDSLAADKAFASLRAG